MEGIKIFNDKVIEIDYRVMQSELPLAEELDGYYAELHYSEAKGFWYEYLPLPIADETHAEVPIAYEYLVEQKIRQQYTISQEFAILRQKDDKPSEYADYYAYCEQCKQEAKSELNLI